MRLFRPANQLSTSRLCSLILTLLLGLCLLAGCSEGPAQDPLSAIHAQQATGDNAGSIPPLRALLKTRPDDAEANFLYGRALAMTGQPHIAIWSLRKAMRDPEWMIHAAQQLAFIALAGRDFNEVVTLTDRVLEVEPDNTRALLMRANAYAHWKKDPEQALEIANRLLEIDPNVIEAYEPRILALLDLERFEEASAALAQAGEMLKEREGSEGVLAWHCSTTAAFEEEAGDLDKTRKTWERCLESYPADAEVVTSALSFYDAQGEYDHSLSIVRAALAEQPDSRAYRVLLANRLRSAGKTVEAEALLREATRTDDAGLAVTAWADLAELHQLMDEHGAAADAFERAVELALELEAADPQLLFERADALLLANRLERALEVAEELPVEAHRRLIRARVAQERGNAELALSEFVEALKLWPDNTWARYYSARAAEEVGDFERALEDYRYAVRISPGATDARVRGARLLLARGQPGQALQMLYVGQAEESIDIESLLLSVYISGRMGSMAGISETLEKIQANHPAWTGWGLTRAAEGLEERAGPGTAARMLATAPGVDYGDPRFVPALRSLVLYSHAADMRGNLSDGLREILASQPDSGAFQDVLALDLELSGAPKESTLAVYRRALEFSPRNVYALTGLGRLEAADNPEQALAYFDRAVETDPSNPDHVMLAVQLLIDMGELDGARERLDQLLGEHPYEIDAAMTRVRLDLQQGVDDPRSLERAKRAVRFGGGVDALELLSQVYAKRGNTQKATEASRRAGVLRESAAAKSNSGLVEEP